MQIKWIVCFLINLKVIFTSNKDKIWVKLNSTLNYSFEIDITAFVVYNNFLPIL